VNERKKLTGTDRCTFGQHRCSDPVEHQRVVDEFCEQHVLGPLERAGFVIHRPPDGEREHA